MLLIGVAGLASGADSAPSAFDRSAWLSDYVFLKSELEKSYSHLAWFASTRSGIDLPAVDRRTKAALDRAADDGEARLAVRNFVSSIGDGHFSELPSVEAATAPTKEPPARDLTHDDAIAGCAALGYADKSQAAFSLPFESLPDFVLQADGISSRFRAGLIAFEGRRIGVVRIKHFSQTQYPIGCIEAWAEHAKLDKAGEEFREHVIDGWFSSLASQLARFREDGVQVVIVDIGANSGGNDSGDWAARLFTDKPVRSARLLMTASHAAESYADEQLAEIGKAMRPDAAGPLQDQAKRSLDFFSSRKTLLGKRSCAMAWAWQSKRVFAPDGCSHLIDVGFASGPVNALTPGSYDDRHRAAKIYWPSIVEPWRGTWRGPVYVLTNATTYSAAELFTAVMKDNGIAKVVGAKTGGDGCGFMVEAAPVVLPHSRMRFRVPNCVRLRADGTDEVAGIAPDLPVLATEGEGPRARAVRVLATVVNDSKLTIAATR